MRLAPAAAGSHLEMAVSLDAWVHFGLCARICHEVWGNGSIDMSRRGAWAKLVFDFEEATCGSTEVACNECIQACPTRARAPKSALDVDRVGRTDIDRALSSACPDCMVDWQINHRNIGDALERGDGPPGPSGV